MRQNQIEGTGNDDNECWDFLNTKLKRNAELLEDEGASAIKKKKIGFVDYVVSNKEHQGLSKDLKMIALAKLKRPDISAHNLKMFSRTLEPTIKFTTSRQLKKQPSSTSKSVRQVDRLLIVKISQEPVGVEHLDSVSWHGIEILQQLLRK